MSLGFSRFWERSRDQWYLAAAVVLSFLFIALDQTAPVLFLKKEIGSLTRTGQIVFSWIPRLLEARRENQRLIMKVGELSLREDQYREALLENRRLRKLLGFKKQGDFDFIPAEVVGIKTIGIPGLVYLNVGWEDGCKKNMVLMTDKGVVGKIVSVSKSTSVGELLTDPNFRISAKVERSRVLGIVRWLYGNVCTLEGVPRGSDVKIGDLIITSGYSQIYPPGLVIGRVFKVSQKNRDLFQNILLRTEVDFGTLEELLVLKNPPQNQKGE